MSDNSSSSESDTDSNLSNYVFSDNSDKNNLNNKKIEPNSVKISNKKRKPSSGQINPRPLKKQRQDNLQLTTTNSSNSLKSDPAKISKQNIITAKRRRLKRKKTTPKLSSASESDYDTTDPESSNSFPKTPKKVSGHNLSDILFTKRKPKPNPKPIDLDSDWGSDGDESDFDPKKHTVNDGELYGVKRLDFENDSDYSVKQDKDKDKDLDLDISELAKGNVVFKKSESDQELINKIQNKPRINVIDLLTKRINNTNEIRRNTNPNHNKELARINKLIDSETPTETMILNLDVSDEIKADFIQLLGMMLHAHEIDGEESKSYYDNRSELIRKIKESKKKKSNVVSQKKKELFGDESPDYDEMSIEYRILSSDHSDHNKKIMYQRYSEIKELDAGNDKGKYLRWLEQALKLPTKSPPADISNDMFKLMEEMDAELHGMEEVKLKILKIINKRRVNNTSKGCCIGLVGKPGVGKTSIARMIGKIMKLPFFQVSIGGCKDSALIKGSNIVYESPEPSIISQALIQMKSTKGVILIDEIDKLSATNEGMQVSYSLLNVLDFGQNSDFTDEFFGPIKIDLSGNVFIVSLNDTNAVDPTLLNRMDIIEVDGYDEESKTTIIKDYILPEVTKSLNISMNENENNKNNEIKLKISDGVIRHIVDIRSRTSINNDVGVRQVKNDITNICEYVSLYFNCYKLLNKYDESKLSRLGLHHSLSIKNNTVTLTNKDIDNLLQFDLSGDGDGDTSDYIT